MTENGKVEVADIDRLRDVLGELLEEEVLTSEVMGGIYDILVKASERKKAELMEEYLMNRMKPEG